MTPRERAERLIDLTGEIKQADQLVAECERDVTERWRQYELALGAAQKQRERRLALYDEAKHLGEEAKADFDALVPADIEVRYLNGTTLRLFEADDPEALRGDYFGPQPLAPPEDDFDAAIRSATKAHLGEEAKADFDALVPGGLLPVHAAWDFAKPEGSDAHGGFEAGEVKSDVPHGDGGSGGIAFDQAIEDAWRTWGPDPNCPNVATSAWSGPDAKITDAFNAATTPQDTGDKTHIFGNGRLP